MYSKLHTRGIQSYGVCLFDDDDDDDDAACISRVYYISFAKLKHKYYIIFMYIYNKKYYIYYRVAAKETGTKKRNNYQRYR